MKRMLGFTIIEMVVLAVILIASAAIVYPVVSSEIRRSDRAQAEEHCRQIAVALDRYIQDKSEQKFPVQSMSQKPLDWLRGPGNIPRNNSFDHGGPNGRIGQVLREKNPDMTGWKGPYLDAVDPDPWGNAYLVNCHGFHDSRERIWILSAGANGIVETPPQCSETRGDDIGRTLR